MFHQEASVETIKLTPINFNNLADSSITPGDRNSRSTFRLQLSV